MSRDIIKLISGCNTLNDHFLLTVGVPFLLIEHRPGRNGENTPLPFLTSGKSTMP